MNHFPMVMAIAAALLLTRWAAERWLDHLNRRNLLAHAGAVPEAFRETIDAPAYTKSVEYTLAKAQFGGIEETFSAILLAVVVFSGVLPWALQSFAGHFGNSAWAMSAFLFAVGVALTLPGLPFAWHAQFRLEEQFGFNTTTPKIWWLDRVKGFAARRRAGLSAAGADFETGRMDRPALVVVGLGLRAWGFNS